jgi:predicted choloylglycine hydrolase
MITGISGLLDRTEDGQAQALELFAAHMPELIPVHARLAGALDLPGGAAFLAQATIKPPFSACSQAPVDGVLVRNYDFDPARCERTISLTSYLRPVIGMREIMWGLLDGMNDAGLAVSLTFGGRPVWGPGFCITMVIRYLLETCESVQQAWDKLRTLPIATVQNLTLVDPHEALSVHVGPDIPATIADEACVTNHQGSVDPDSYADSLNRLAAIRDASAAATSADDVVAALLKPPLYNPASDGTLYTAAYRTAEGRVSYIWPAERWEQSFEDFTTGSRSVLVGD